MGLAPFYDATQCVIGILWLWQESLFDIDSELVIDEHYYREHWLISVYTISSAPK
jgi:hypothetical protein